MPRLMSSHGLVAFLAVAEHGSINAAAEHLHISQPALTRTIKELEDYIGARLFERNPKGVTPTAFGQVLISHARRLRSELELIERNAQSYRASKRLHMSIGAVPVHPVALVAKAFADFQKRENIEMSIVIGSQMEMIELLRSGKVETVLGPLLTHKDSTGLLQEVINYEGPELYCRPDHPLAAKSQPTPHDLGSAQWVLGGRDTTLRAKIDEHFARAGIFLDVPMEIEDVSLRRSLVAQSNFVSAFQNHHVFNELRNGTLVKIDYIQLQDQQPVGCIRISEHSAQSQQLVDLLRRSYEMAGLA
jgi:molybdate transport repressor ModE-like protein